ncbi:MAG: molybdopterin-guanine dinucleotide biosynthesis protein B [Syntrophales bacterium]|nr:molybdopterin-guanine dinucleotide biosynthesis protein B [Syntrophales bacterium]
MREREKIAVLSIVGRSNSGKTTLIEKIIPELKKRGWQVGTIKHNRHGFEIDHEGKDSYRHRRAGAKVTVIASPQQIAVIQEVERDYEIGELISRFISGVDIVLVEGFKENAYPKIEMRRFGVSGDPIYGKKDNLLAYVGDVREEREVPFFHWDEIEKIVDLIEEYFGRA